MAIPLKAHDYRFFNNLIHIQRVITMYVATHCNDQQPVVVVDPIINSFKIISCLTGAYILKGQTTLGFITT